MLQGKEAVIGDARGVRMAENGEDAALVSGFGFLSQGLVGGGERENGEFTPRFKA